MVSVTLVTQHTTPLSHSGSHFIITRMPTMHCYAPSAGRSRLFLPPPHLAAGHVGHGAVGLDGLQLVQAPVQLLQRLARPPDIVLVWKAKISSEGHNILFCMSEPEGSERARWEKGRWGPDTMDARLKIFFISTMLLG